VKNKKTTIINKMKYSNNKIKRQTHLLDSNKNSVLPPPVHFYRRNIHAPLEEIFIFPVLHPI